MFWLTTNLECFYKEFIPALRADLVLSKSTLLISPASAKLYSIGLRCGQIITLMEVWGTIEMFKLKCLCVSINLMCSGQRI